ncbi:hypothetical protein EZS27_043999, partial [termite gut metagenome]
REYADFQRTQGEDIFRQQGRVTKKTAELMETKKAQAFLLDTREQERIKLEKEEQDKHYLISNLQKQQKNLQNEINQKKKEANKIDKGYMDSSNITKILTLTVDKLSENESCKELFHQYKEGEPLLSAQALNDVIELARAILFPGYYGNPTADEQAIHHHIEVNVETLFNLLIEQ